MGGSRSPAGPRARAVLAALPRRAPRRFDGARVVRVGELDGLRLELEDGFVLWRASGTEPLVRVYAEAPSRRALARRLAAAAARLGRVDSRKRRSASARSERERA